MEQVNLNLKESGLFDAVGLAGIPLANRFAVAPMTRVSATADGRATSRMTDYYRAFADGGFSLVITEGIYTDKVFAQGYLHQPGLTDAEQAGSWRRVVQAVHGAGGKLIAQLMHAGALSQGNPHRTFTAGPSAVRPSGCQLSIYRGEGQYPVPAAMTQADIDKAVAGFVDAARRAQDAGFDGVEVHGANGYLLDQFLSEGINFRDDAYGGDFKRRAALVIRVLSEIRGAVGKDFPVGVRFSQAKVNDFDYRWNEGEALAAYLFKSAAAAGASYLHTTEYEAWRPAFGNDGPSLAALAKLHSALPIIANGSLHDIERADEMVRAGHADIIAIGRGALTHEDFPTRVASGNPISEFDRDMLSPVADLANQDLHRLQSRAA